MTTEIPQCDMIIMFVQSDKYNPKGFLKIAQCEPGLRLSKTVSSFTLFLDYVTANTCKNNVNEHHNILSSKFCKTQNLSLPILLATTIDVNCIIIGSHECTVEHKRPTSVSGFSLNNILKLPFVFHQTISYSPRTLGIYDLL